jgi:hypothetical protein
MQTDRQTDKQADGLRVLEQSGEAMNLSGGGGVGGGGVTIGKSCGER